MTWPRFIIVLILGAGVLLADYAVATEPQGRPRATNELTEVSFTSRAWHSDPFNDLTLDVVFKDPAGVERRVPAFWEGGTSWKVRYASGIVGTHAFHSECSDTKDPGLQNVQGHVEIVAYTGSNPLYLHGPLRVAKGGRFLEQADGTPFLWLGDTWWMSLCKRLSWPLEFKELAADRKRKGFNVVQIVAGLYPDMPAFDPRGENEAGVLWEKDYARIRPEYFDAADARIFYLVEQGFVPCIVGAWGFHEPWLGDAKMLQHERYVYARWGALPMVWCVAGEIDMPFYLQPKWPSGGEKQMAGWTKVLRGCRAMNCFDRVITAHSMSSTRTVIDPALIDVNMVQSPHGQMDVLPITSKLIADSYAATPVMPTIHAEPSYEMLWDKTPAEVVCAIFWYSWMNGTRAYTYGANGLWQLNRQDHPYGNSPQGANYGKTTWNDAMNLPGAEQVALATQLIGHYPWQSFTPQTQWVSWAQGDSGLSPAGMGTADTRILYVPHSAPILVKNLDARHTWSAIQFDPLSGQHAQLPDPAPDQSGVWRYAPAAVGHDYVLILTLAH